jgi:hypothetical protein
MCLYVRFVILQKINFGLLGAVGGGHTIREQLEEQEINANNVECERFKKIRMSVNCLYFQGYVPQTTRNKIFDKVFKEITKQLTTQ